MPGAGKLPAEWEQLWRRGAAAHEEFMREFDAAGGAVTDAAWSALESAAESLEELGQYKLDPTMPLTVLLEQHRLRHHQYGNRSMNWKC